MFLAELPGAIDMAAMVVNGNGIPEGTLDDDANKNFALRLAREFGPVRIGASAYSGTTENQTGLERSS